VIEITEQVPVESYAVLRGILDHLRGHVRVAVDDAGAGYAGLRHILEIQPQIVKLDIALVRGVNADPARRALISSMVAFAPRPIAPWWPRAWRRSRSWRRCVASA
jgi:EAL domain-containing protein (putative c-di-GMP-specific phosphodiesterase class I)